jgi:hypothetical protein
MVGPCPPGAGADSPFVGSEPGPEINSLIKETNIKVVYFFAGAGAILVLAVDLLISCTRTSLLQLAHFWCHL